MANLMRAFKHDYSFDPSYGYTLEDLYSVTAPEPPHDFESFWRNRYEKVHELSPEPILLALPRKNKNWLEQDISYQSTGGAKIGGWCLTPEFEHVERVVIILHGYGGREQPDDQWNLPNTAFLFPCARGMGRSPYPPVSPISAWHVLHDIQDPKLYIHGACVEDVWMAVSAALVLFPHCAGRVGLMGTSFGGGIGAMALAWDARISRAHFCVPSFGNQALRLQCKTTGSGAAVQAMHRRYPEAIERTLSYHDAAIAARWIQVPVHLACAVFDPMVAPPGQFAIYNAVPSEKKCFILPAGHFSYPAQEITERELLQEIHEFFSRL